MSDIDKCGKPPVAGLDSSRFSNNPIKIALAVLRAEQDQILDQVLSEIEFVKARQDEDSRRILALESEKDRVFAIDALCDLGCVIPREECQRTYTLWGRIGAQITRIAEADGDKPNHHKRHKPVSYINSTSGLPERREKPVNTYLIKHVREWIRLYRNNTTYSDPGHPDYLGTVLFPADGAWSMKVKKF